MKVVLNSDILYHTYLLRDRFSPHLEEFFKGLATKGHKVVIPKTTLLEFDRKQTAYLEKQRDKLVKAYETLHEYRIDYKPEE